MSVSYDVVLVADPRFPGGTSSALASEIRALASAGLNLGLVRKRARILRRERPDNPLLRACLAEGLVEEVPSDQPVRAPLAVIHNPHVFEDLDDVCERAPVRAGRIVIVGHQVPRDANGTPWYDHRVVHRNVAAFFGAEPCWAPVSSSARALFAAAGVAPMLGRDWVQVFFPDEWSLERGRPDPDVVAIGRHSRPDWQKWPDSRELLLAAYPDTPPFRVCVLGAGPELDRLLGGIVPDNWELLPFGAVDVRDFLASIDHWVYYHHSSWVETFGRTVVEAALSGLVPVVSHGMARNFPAGMVLSADIRELRRVLLDLHADAPRLIRLRGIARDTAAEAFAPGRLVALVRDLVTEHRPVSTAVYEPVSFERVPDPSFLLPPLPDRLEVVRAGDFADPCSMLVAMSAEEVRIEASRGLRCGLVHLCAHSGADAAVRPLADALVREGLAAAVPPSHQAEAGLLIFLEPVDLHRALIGDRPPALPRVRARTLLLLQYRPCSAEEVSRADRFFRAVTGLDPRWAGCGPAEVAVTDADVMRAEHPWVPVAAVEGDVPIPLGIRDLPVVGWAGPAWSRAWPEDPDAVFPSDGSHVLSVWGWPVANFPSGADASPFRRTMREEECDAATFFRHLDLFCAAPAKPHDLGFPAILALAHGRPVAVPDPALVAGRRTGLGIVPATKLVHEAHRWFALRRDNPDGWLAEARRIARETRRDHGPAVHLARLARLGAQRPTKASGIRQSWVPTVMLVSTNGVGVGHLTRLLAVARRIRSDRARVICVTHSHAYRVVRQFGLPVERLGHADHREDALRWSRWHALRLQELLDTWRPQAVVFDGGMPYRGLVQALGGPRDTALVWMRRGLWRAHHDIATAVRRQGAFDLVIRPEDLSERDPDPGSPDPTLAPEAAVGTLRVPPVVLYESGELPSRDQALAELGLDADRRYALVALGSGANRDIAALVDSAVRALRSHDLVPVVIRWANSGVVLPHHPGAVLLDAYPLGRWLRAFDLLVAAAGYNTFHEAVLAGVPAVWVPNDNPAMDDQGRRARWIARLGGGLVVPDSRPADLEIAVAVLADPAWRAEAEDTLARIDLGGDGAAAAAEAILSVLD